MDLEGRATVAMVRWGPGVYQQLIWNYRHEDGAPVSTQEPPLGQRGHTMDCGEQFTGVLPASASGPLTAGFVGVAEFVDAAVAGPAVGDHPRAWLDVFGDEGMQRPGRPVGQDRHPGPAVPARFFELNRDAHKGFLALGAPTAQSWLLAADVGLVDLDRAGQPGPGPGAPA